MRALMGLVFSAAIGCLSRPAVASESAFVGAFQGTGGACSGALYVLAHTIEWNSAFSVCKPTAYEMLERSADGERERIVYRLKQRSRHCRYAVVELAHEDGYSWEVSGYQSLEGFQKRDTLDWLNSPLPDRLVLACPMIRLD